MQGSDSKLTLQFCWSYVCYDITLPQSLALQWVLKSDNVTALILLFFLNLFWDSSYYIEWVTQVG